MICQLSLLPVSTLSNLKSSRVLVFGRLLAVASVTVAAGVVLARQVGVLQPLELAAFDWLTRQRPDNGPDPRLLVVEITEADIRGQKRWPLSDRVLAQVLTKLVQFQPRAIGLDLYRDIPQEPGHAQLQAKLKNANIIAIANMGSGENNVVLPPAGVPPERIGFNDVLLDGDGVIRRNLLFASTNLGSGTKVLYSFSLRLAIAYLKNSGIPPKNSRTNPDLISWGKARLLPLASNSGGYAKLDAAGYQLLLNYRTRGPIARTVTLTEVLSGKLDPRLVKDKIVLVGTTAPSLKDLYATPYSVFGGANSKMPGVMIHAQMLSHLLDAVKGDRPLLWYWSERAEALWIWVWAIVGGLLVLSIRSPYQLAAAAVVAIAVLLGVGGSAFAFGGWVPVVPPVLAFVASGACVAAFKWRYNLLHDALTGLPNQTLFLQQVNRAFYRARRRPDYRFAVLFLDLDRFKVINQSLGHDLGDRLIELAAERILAFFKSLKNSPFNNQFQNYFLSAFNFLKGNFTLARLGGDEFAVLIEEIAGNSEATDAAARLLQQMVLPFNLSGQEVFVTASTGIAIASPSPQNTDIPIEKLTATSLLQNAHTAMYRAKALGRNRYEVFESSMYAQVVKRLQLETDMRLAIARQEFLLHYQPIISLSTGKLVGFEALARWQHPNRGMVSPGEFIPVAEETGLIIQLGAWAMREACRQLQHWNQQWRERAPLMVSVNLSGKQFSQGDLIEQIEATLSETGLDASCLKLEITESVVMENIDGAIDMLLQLRALNIQLGLDDFGTGYSSLSYLHRFPVNTLKVDRSFVMRLESGGDGVEIVRTVLMLAHTLGMDAVAEGVETAAQAEKLRAIGCEYGQGYFFAKPLPVEAVEALLASDPQW